MSKKFEFGIVIDAIPLNEIAKGYDFYELPTALKCLPFDCEENWRAVKADLDLHEPTCKVSSHYLQYNGLTAAGPKFDREQQLFWADRAFRRMNEAGVKVVGVYGGFFKYLDGYSRTKTIDDSISFCNILADHAEKYDMLIALEPIANKETVFPAYKDGIQFAKETGRSSLRVMADLNYFLRGGQPLEHLLDEPDYCQHVHIQGDGGAQPNVGDRKELVTRLFTILKEIGYEKGVSAACPWKPTRDGEIDYLYETGVTLRWMQEIRDQVYKG